MMNAIGDEREVIHSNSKKATHAETKARELCTAGMGGGVLLDNVIPIAHRGSSNKASSSSSQRKNGYQQIDSDDEIHDHLIKDQHSSLSPILHDDEEIGTHNKQQDDDDDIEDYDLVLVSDLIPDRSLCHLFGINSFAFAYGLLIATFGLITLPTEAEKLYPQAHAILLASFLVICGISQLSGPIAGYLSDRCNSIYGRRRPYLFGGACIGIPSLLILRYASNTYNTPLYIFFFFIAMLAVNVMYVAYSGALTDLVNENQRGIANGLMGAFSVTGASIGFGCFSYFLDIENGYLFYVFILSLSVLISMISYTEKPNTILLLWTWKEIRESYWLDPIEHSDFFLVFVSRTFYYMGVSVQTFMLFYFRDVIHSNDPQADVSYLALLGQMSGAIFCVPMGLLSNHVGRKPLIYLSTTILIATYIMFMIYQSRFMTLIGGAIYGIGNGTYLSVDYALACDTIPSKDNAARYLGIWGVGAFIGTLLGPLLIGPALLYFGTHGKSGRNEEPHYDTDGTTTMYDLAGYQSILIIGCICFAAGAITIAPVKSAK